MGLRLNQRGDDVVQRDLERSRTGLARWLATPPPEDPAELEKHFDRIGDNALTIGLALYQQGQSPGDVVQHLALAGESMLRMHEVRRPPAKNQHRDPWTFLQTAALVTCFGPPRDRPRLAAIREHQLHHPPSPHHRRLIAALQVLIPFVAGHGFDLERGNEVRAACLEDDASKADQQRVLPLLDGALAITAARAALDAAIATLVRAHAVEARQGDLRLLLAGFVCLDALMLARLGADAGLPCTVESPYLPAFLLGVERAA